MRETTYILAPKNAQNETVFDYAIATFPEISQQGRVNEKYKKDPRDVVDIINNIYEFFGPVFLCIEAITADIPSELIDQIDSSEMYTEPADVTAKFW